MPPKTPNETELILVFSQICKAGVTTGSQLMAMQTLRNMFEKSLYQWCMEAPCSMQAVIMACKALCMKPEDMVCDFLLRLFAAREDQSYPRLDRLLKVAHEAGADAMPHYLLRAMHNFAIGKQRQTEVYAEPDNDEETERLKARVSQLGSSFVGDLTLMARAVGCSHAAVADVLMAGQQKVLVASLIRKLSDMIGHDMTEQLSGMMARAESYVLPEKYAQDRRALMGHVMREESAARRNR